MKKSNRPKDPSPSYTIAAISLVLFISGAALTYALLSGRLSVQKPIEENNGLGSAPGELPAAGLASPTPDPASVPVSGSPVIPGSTCIPDNASETGTVIEVLDGDTIRVKLDRDGNIYPVHYAGIDAPESRVENEYLGTEAMIRNSELVDGKAVTLIKDISETDRFGELARYVLTDTVFINYELIAQGYAQAVADSPDTSCIATFKQAQDQAAGLMLGIWGVPNSVSPGSNAPCNCTGSELGCLDFDTQKQSQACLDHCISEGYGDPFDLDYDGDGRACEQLP